MSAPRRRCRWCHRLVKDQRRYYCDKHCSEKWAYYISAARESNEQRTEWIIGRLVAMADAAAQEGNDELFIRASRELRQFMPPQTEQAVAMDAAAKELLEVYGQ